MLCNIKKTDISQIWRTKELVTGIKNVFRYNKIYFNVENNDFIEDDIFVTTVLLKIFNKQNAPLNDRQQVIIEDIAKNKKITKKEIAQNIGYRFETIKETLVF